MDSKALLVLIHSPLVGPLTWSLVADHMRQRGVNVVIPSLSDSPDSKEPFWKQHAESISQALAQVPSGTSLVLVAHSGAGPLLPAIRQWIPNPVKAYIFADAGLPRDGASRLDLMNSEDSEWAKQFQDELERGERFPTWSFEDLQEIIPDEELRRQMVAELRPRTLDFFTEPIPVPKRWPDAPCAYIQFSVVYEPLAKQAEQAGWSIYKLDAGHFHMLVEPEMVADMLIKAVNNLS